MTVAFALLAALGQRGQCHHPAHRQHQQPQRSTGWRPVRVCLSDPLWLLGWVALLGAFVFQALALRAGQLSVVQTLLITELVFALAAAHLDPAGHQRLGVGLRHADLGGRRAVFLTVAEPRGGHLTPTSGAWLSSILGCGLAAAVAGLLALRGPPARRAALSAGMVWALEATFIKSMTDTLVSDGIGGSLARWPIYTVAVGGVVGTLLVQAALHVGPLRASQPFFVMVHPVVSIFLSVHLFDEYFTGGVADLLIGSVAFVVMCVGVVLLLARTVPEDVQGPAVAVQPTSSG